MNYPAKEFESVNYRSVLIILILSMFITPIVDAREQNPKLQLYTETSHDIVIEAISWKSFPILCSVGDTLSGEFRLVSNGDLFPGDQTKYDNWLLGGIDFLVLDDENYELWVGESLTDPIFERYSLIELVWSVEIPNEGMWYIVYSNDSIFMKRVEGSILRSSPKENLIQLLVLIGVASLLTLILIYWKKK